MSTRSLAAGRVPGTLQGIMLLLRVTLSVMGIVILIPVLPQMPKLVETLQWNIHRDPDPAGRWLRDKLEAAPLEGSD